MTIARAGTSPGGSPSSVDEAADEEPCADEEHHGERHFGRDQNGPEAPGWGGATLTSTGREQHPDVGPRGHQRRDQPEEQRCQRRERDRERQHLTVDSDRPLARQGIGHQSEERSQQPGREQHAG